MGLTIFGSQKYLELSH